MRGESRIFLETALSLCLLVFMLAGDARGQQASGAGTTAQPSTKTATPGQDPSKTSAAPKQAPPATPHPTLADFAWLDGHWRGDWGPRVAEQVWMAPKAGMMTGLFRLVENDKTLVLEMFTMVEKPEGINFYFRHFTPELVPWEKADATVLNFSSTDAKTIEFENPLNGQPKRAILIRVDADTYTARSEIVPDQGDMQVIEITYHRVKAVPEKPSVKSGGHQ